MGRVAICLGCAHAVKFLPTVAQALQVTPAQALAAVPELDAHPCVRAVGAMARKLDAHEGGSASQSATPKRNVLVFRRGDDWEAQLRALISNIVTARRERDALSVSASPRPPSRPKCKSRL